MSWIECLESRDQIDELFSTPPELCCVRIVEIVLHQDGPRVSLRIDLNEFPEKPPRKWTDNKYNRVQLTLQFIEVHQLRVQGWSMDNIVDIVIERVGGKVLAELRGESTTLQGEFGFVAIERITAYYDGETPSPAVPM